MFWLVLLPNTLSGGGVQNPYLGILSYLMLPGIFIGGLILIPLGIIWEPPRERHARPVSGNIRPTELGKSRTAAAVDLCRRPDSGQHRHRQSIDLPAVAYMDSVKFCGTTCHTVMKPEYTAYQNSPHSRVECVTCHIGPGASWFVRSKVTGLGQVLAVALNNYPRPIPTPVHNLRPARETCEGCHWPQKYATDRLQIMPKYAEDENNTATKTVLMLKVGGGNNGVGIHGTHIGKGVNPVRAFR